MVAMLFFTHSFLICTSLVNIFCNAVHHQALGPLVAVHANMNVQYLLQNSLNAL